MSKALLKWLQIVSLAAGLALFAHLVKQTGVAALIDYLAMMGWGFAAIIALSVVRNLLRAASWYYAIDPAHRLVTFWSLVNVMLAGEAIKYLTATGPLLGEPAKAAMVRREVPLIQGFSSVIVENLIYNLTVFLVMLAGVPALAWLIDVPHRLQVAAWLFAATLLLVIGLVWLAVRGRWFILARMLEQLRRLTARRRPARSTDQPPRFVKIITRVREVEANVYAFYEERRGAFFGIFAVNLLAHLVNVIEVCLILALLGLPASLAAGFVVEAVTKVINGAFFFVPTRAGVYESGNALTLSAIGLGAGAGLALAVIRKLRAFVWIAYGLGAIAVISFKDRRAQQSLRDDEAARFGLSESPPNSKI
jgi:Lysylphosphatidylglycerol synthase TM region